MYSPAPAHPSLRTFASFLIKAKGSRFSNPRHCVWYFPLPPSITKPRFDPTTIGCDVCDIHHPGLTHPPLSSCPILLHSKAPVLQLSSLSDGTVLLFLSFTPLLVVSRPPLTLLESRWWSWEKEVWQVKVTNGANCENTKDKSHRSCDKFGLKANFYLF